MSQCHPKTLEGFENQIGPKITTFESRRVITEGLDENYIWIRVSR